MTETSNWWRGGVIYQVYPRSFQDTTGDGSGDLKGITRRLGHIASLGVDAVWLSPFFKSPMADMGYDVSDYCDVDPMFGTLADFDALVENAHGLGLKIIIDQVLSHTSDQHAWFRESRSSRNNPKAEWYVWADPKPDGTAPNNWMSIFGGPGWEWDTVRKQYYLHNFLASQPDLNFHTPAVQDALLESVRFWLDRGVDGFRLDTVNFYVHDWKLRDNPPMPQGASNDIPDTNPYGYQKHVHDKTQPENLLFLKRFRALLDEYADRASVGEVGDGMRSLKTVAAYTADGDKLHMCYTFDLLSPKFSADHVRKCVADFEKAVTEGWVCWAFSNHDVKRHVSRFVEASGADPDAIAKFSIGLLACLRGSICLYQGEELGLTEAELLFEQLRDPYGIRFWPGFKGRDGCRTPMPWEGDAPGAGFSAGTPWLPVPPEHLARAVDAQGSDGVLARYREILAFRRTHRPLVDGSITILRSPGDGLMFLREAGNEQLLCAFNFALDPAKVVVPKTVGNVTPIGFPGAEGTIAAGSLSLPALGMFVGRAAKLLHQRRAPATCSVDLHVGLADTDAQR